ncbi:MAG TPA: hypothetical protein VGZ25_10705 [Gemmataceae bacterium]|jgi:hypothetical protein|nr:hypothetical protein [Gemmataceae bacterium]
MKALLLLGLFLGCLSLALAAPAAKEKFTCVDLKAKFNHKLGQKAGIDAKDGNELPLKAGEQTFEGITFQISGDIIQLGSKIRTDDPEKVEGIKIGKTFDKLHIVQATCYGGGPNVAGTSSYLEDGTEIGEYKVHYDDKSVETIPIAYGVDVRDWWFREDEKGPSRAKVAWKGENEASKKFDCGVRLYLMTWKNPKPDTKVVSIDFIGNKEKTVVAPFCMAMTLEEE